MKSPNSSSAKRWQLPPVSSSSPLSIFQLSGVCGVTLQPANDLPSNSGLNPTSASPTAIPAGFEGGGSAAATAKCINTRTGIKSLMDVHLPFHNLKTAGATPIQLLETANQRK